MNNSIRINYVAVVTAGILSFVLSLMWYSPIMFGEIWFTYRHAPNPKVPGWTMIFAPFRELIAAYVLALLITQLQITHLKKAVQLTLLLWLTFHAVGMAGAVIWDNMAWQLGMVHASDWLMKMLFMAIVITTWNRKTHKEASTAPIG